MPNNILQGVNVNGTVYKYDYEALENVPDYLSMPDLKGYYYDPVLSIVSSTTDDSKACGWVEPDNIINAVLRQNTADITCDTPPVLALSTSDGTYTWKYVEEILEDMFREVTSDSIGDNDSIVIYKNDKLSLVSTSDFKAFLTPDVSEN